MNEIIEGLYQAIALDVFQAKPEIQWTNAKYQVTMITCMSDAICTFILNDGASKSVDAGYDIQNNFSKLREEMAKLNPENGAWYTATFNLTPDGNFKFDFDYDHLPAFDIIPSPDKWTDEFKHYPRPELQAHVQDWMDKKAEHNVIVDRLRELQRK